MSEEQPEEPLLDREEDPRFIAAVDLIGRTGALGFQIRYSDEEMPVVWNAVAWYPALDGEHPHLNDPKSGEPAIAQAGGGMTPLQAIFELCNKLIDGGLCTHCGRATAFTEDLLDTSLLDQAIIPIPVCWTSYDPELKTFRRGCEGDN